MGTRIFADLDGWRTDLYFYRAQKLAFFYSLQNEIKRQRPEGKNPSSCRHYLSKSVFPSKKIAKAIQNQKQFLTHFKDMFRIKAVRHFLITYLSILLIWHIFVAIAFGEIWSVIPLGIQFFIIALIVIEHSWTATFLRTWVIVFVIAAQGLKIAAKILASLNGELEYVTSPMFYLGVFQFFMGFVILYLAKVFIVEE